MVFKCAVFGCKGNYDKGKKVSIFKFPKDTELKSQWIKRLMRKNFEPSSSSRVCELHFRKEDILHEVEFFYQKTGKLLKSTLLHPRLKEGTIPSIFPYHCPFYLQSTAVDSIAANSASDVPDKAESILPNVPNLAIVKKEPVDDAEEIFPSTSGNIPSLQSSNSFMPSVKLEITTSEDCVNDITIPVNPNAIAPPATTTDTGENSSSTKFICTDGTEPPPKRPNLSQIPPFSNTEIKDEFSIFGNYVADKIRSFADRSLQVEAQHLITNLLFEIERKDLNKDSLPVISQFSSVQKPLPTKVILPSSTAIRKIPSLKKPLTAKVKKSSSVPMSYTQTLQTQIPAAAMLHSSSTSSSISETQLPATVMLPSNSAISRVSSLQAQMPATVRSPSNSPISVVPSLQEQMPVTITTLPISSSISKVSSLQEHMPVTVVLPTSSSISMTSNLQRQLPTTVMLPSTSVSSFTSENTVNLNMQVKSGMPKQI